MPNNIGPLPLSGRITLQDIADVFYLYRPYTDLTEVNIYDYYGDKIAHYYPFQPPIPTTGNIIRVSNFYGKQYLLPITINLSAVPTPIYNYATATVTLSTTSLDVFKIANGITSNPTSYNIPLTTAQIPFWVVVNNYTFVQSTTPLSAGILVQGNFNTTSTVTINNSGNIVGAPSVDGGPHGPYAYTGSSSWTVPAGVDTVDFTAVGGGGGGGSGQEQGNGGAGGGGGAGGAASGTVSVVPGDVFTYSAGGGGYGGPGAGRGSVNGGGSGGDTYIYLNGNLIASAGGGGGGGGGGSGSGGSGGGGGYPNGGSGGRGQSGTNDKSSGSGGSGGSNGTGYGNGGSGASFYDRSPPLSWSGSSGGSGVALFSYIVHAIGGSAIKTDFNNTAIHNTGLLAGGFPAYTSSDIYGKYVEGIANVTTLPLTGTLVGNVA